MTNTPGCMMTAPMETSSPETVSISIPSFDQIATRKNERQEGGWNTWYSHYSLPADAGIRLVLDEDRLSGNGHEILMNEYKHGRLAV